LAAKQDLDFSPDSPAARWAREARATTAPMKLDILRPTYRAEVLPKDARHPA
jgi:hypothetical protein